MSLTQVRFLSTAPRIYMRYSDKYILEQHASHYQTSTYDYWCIARHPENYSPKYMQGEVCHDNWWDNTCNELCTECHGSLCPVEHCNDAEYWDEDEWEWTVPPVIRRAYVRN